MFEISPVILYNSLKRTGPSQEGSSELIEWLERTDRMAQANKPLEGVRSSEVEFARADYFESGKVERRKREARATKVL